jgi:hypothetical protein
VSPDAAPPDAVPADEDTSSSGGSSLVQPASAPTPHPTHQLTQIAFEEAPSKDVQLTLEGFTLDEVTLVDSLMLPYLAMVASVIEGRSIDAEELLYVLRRSMRQRSFDRLPRREYALRFLNQHPP